MFDLSFHALAHLWQAHLASVFLNSMVWKPQEIFHLQSSQFFCCTSTFIKKLREETCPLPQAWTHGLVGWPALHDFAANSARLKESQPCHFAMYACWSKTWDDLNIRHIYIYYICVSICWISLWGEHEGINHSRLAQTSCNCYLKVIPK